MSPALEALDSCRVWKAEENSTAGSESFRAEHEAGGRVDAQALPTLHWPALNFRSFPQILKAFPITGHVL